MTDAERASAMAFVTKLMERAKNYERMAESFEGHSRAKVDMFKWRAQECRDLAQEYKPHAALLPTRTHQKGLF